MRARSSLSVAIWCLLWAIPASAEVYEFTADYCGACRRVKPLVKQLISEGYPIQIVDVQQHSQVAMHFNVQSIPCFIAVRNGQPVGRLEGARSREELVQLCRLTMADTSEQQQAQLATATTGSPLPNRFPETAITQAVALQPQIGGEAIHPTSADDAVAAALAATVKLEVEDAEGVSYGTGTIIDVHDGEALVLTCGHIFRESQGRGRILCNLNVPQASQPIEGNIISFDLRRDVGLISLKPPFAVQPVRVAGSGRRPKQGDTVFSVGCNRGQAPTVMRDQIRAVNRYHGPANLVVGGMPVDGRSGGGLFAADGALIGVCNAADQQQNEGLYAALGPVHAALDSNGLGFIYRSPRTRPSAPASTSENAIAQVQTGNPVEPPMQTPPPNTTGSTQRELICIVRDGDQSGERVFVIDQPSDDLVRQLSQEVNRRGTHAATQMRR